MHVIKKQISLETGIARDLYNQKNLSAAFVRAVGLENTVTLGQYDSFESAMDDLPRMQDMHKGFVYVAEEK